MLAVREVGMDLPRKQRIFRDICMARIFIQREYEEPGDADDNEDCGEVRGKLEQPRIAAQCQQRSCLLLAAWQYCPAHTKLTDQRHLFERRFVVLVLMLRQRACAAFLEAR